MRKFGVILTTLAVMFTISSCTIEGTFTPADESVTGHWSPSE